jgi:hypothetical protein
MEMKHKVYCLISALLVFSTMAFAGTAGKITGKVIDGETREPLPGALVSVSGTIFGANTDYDGRYTITGVPAGVYTIEAKMMGYPTTYIHDVRSVNDSTTYVKVFEMGIFDVQPIKPLVVNSDRLKRTQITPHLKTDIRPNTNLIYCATFQITWNSLQDDFFKAPLLLTGNPWDAEQLNRQEVTERDLDSNSYVAIADTLTQKLLQRINAQLKQKFGKMAPPAVVEKVSLVPSIFSYCYLYKNLLFNKNFHRTDEPLYFGNGKGGELVPAFGITNSEHYHDQAELIKQVEILYYLNNEDFVLRLKTTSATDELILVKTKPMKNLFETIENVNERCKTQDIGLMKKDEELIIPYLDYDISHSFDQFVNKYFLNEGWTEWYIRKAFQKIRFRLNESGALLQSEARIVMEGCMPMKKREYIFNKPFLLMLRKKGSNLPYFAMWVGNAELLGKY